MHLAHSKEPEPRSASIYQEFNHHIDCYAFSSQWSILNNLETSWGQLVPAWAIFLLWI